MLDSHDLVGASGGHTHKQYGRKIWWIPHPHTVEATPTCNMVGGSGGYHIHIQWRPHPHAIR